MQGSPHTRLSAIAAALLAAACGNDGADGKDATTYLTSAIPAAASDCPNGGTTVLIGPDSNRNGQLDIGEILTTAVVCNGADGAPGKDGSPTDLWLVATAEADSDACFWGGTLLMVGRDTNGSGTLDVAEVLTTTSLCNTAVSSGAGNTSVWTGNGVDDRWSTAANWQSGLVPSSGDTLIFPDDAAQRRARNDLPLLTTVTSFQISGNYELYGKKLIHNGTTSVENGTAGVRLISLPMVLHDSVFEVADAAAMAIDLTISGALSGPGGLSKSGTGVLELTGDNSYLGPTTITGSAVRSAAANAIPDSSVVNGKFEVSLIGDTIAGLEGTGALNLLGDLVVGVDGADHAYNGPASGGGALVKRGGGVQHLQAASTSHLGQLRVQEGTLNVTGNWGLSATIVGAGATLAGTSNIGPLTVNAGGALAPGSPGGTGKLTVSGTVTLSGATLTVDLNGTTVISEYDRVSATGLIDLGGSTLHVTVGFTPSTGNAFNIIESVSGFTGTFAELPDGADFVADGTHFSIDYTGSSVVLTVVP